MGPFCVARFSSSLLISKEQILIALFSGRSGNSKSKKKCKPGENCTNLFNLEALWSYGCFCNFGPNWHQSHGQPVNEIDSACRRLYQCYKCATIDGNLEGNICDPANEKYKVPVIRNVHNNGSYVACNQINRNPNISPSDPEYNAVNCKIRTCCCDLNFAKELLEYFFSGMIIDSSKKHANGFDFNQECPSPCADGSCKSGEKRCCGEYPLRFPYNTRDGERDCCWKKTYNTNRLQCCENTFIRKITQDCDG